MERKKLLERRDEMLRREREGFQFEQYQEYLPEAKDDIRLATHYKIRDLILEFKDTRIKQNLTQAEIAEKMGTKQTAVSRFESYETKPTIAFLMKYAKALGKDMVIQLESDFLIEVPQQAREKALQLKAEVNMDIKEFFTEVLVDFVSQRYEPLMSVNSIDALEFTSEKVIEFAGLQTEAV